MNKINEAKAKYRLLCDSILKKGDTVTQDDLNQIEEIIQKDNTEPKFILTKLHVLKKLKKEKEYLNLIKEYKYLLGKDTIKENVQSNEDIPSASKLFYDFLEKIGDFSEKMHSFQKSIFHNKLFSMVPEMNDIKGFLDYESNKEYAIFVLVQKMRNGIYKNIDKIIVENEDENIPFVKYLKALREQAKTYKKVGEFIKGKIMEKPTDEEFKIYDMINKEKENCDPDKLIEEYEQGINFQLKINSDEYSNYFKHLKLFLDSVKDNFMVRFKDIDNLENKEFELLKDFCFFIERYDFKDYDGVSFYVDKWDNTFNQTKEYIETVLKDNSINDINNYRLDDNNLILESYNAKLKTKRIYEIKSIDKYSIDCVMEYFSPKIKRRNKEIGKKEYSEMYTLIDEYEIEHLLKFDCSENIYINKIWNIIESHLLKIFKSKTIKSVFKKFCEKLGINNYYDFLNDDELKNLFKRSKIMPFRIDAFGTTDPIFFVYYIYLKGINKKIPKECSKLLDICFYQITQEHELLGHLDIRIQNYFSKNEITSPFLTYIDNFGAKIESGNYFEWLLYGKVQSFLSLDEILFLLDEENYNVEYDIFSKNFQQIQNITFYKISPSLSKFLEKLNISIDKCYAEYAKIKMSQGFINKSSLNAYTFSFLREIHTLDPPKITKIDLGLTQEDYEKFLESKKNNK